MHNLHDILACYRAMFALDFRSAVPLRVLLVGGAAVAMALFVSKNSNEIDWEAVRPNTAVALGLVTFVALLYVNHSSRFLYFQF